MKELKPLDKVMDVTKVATVLVLLGIAVIALVGCGPTHTVRESEPVFSGPDTRKPAMQLVMMHNPQCYACQRFVDEVPEKYDLSREGFFLPLVVRNIYAPVTQEWYAVGLEEGRLIRVNRTPTFIVLEGELDTGHEIARFVGYNDEETFFNQIGYMIDMYELDDPQKRKVFAQ